MTDTPTNSPANDVPVRDVGANEPTMFFVRLRAYDPRRGQVLRRFGCRGLKFHEERGWYRVPLTVAEYLRGVRQVAGDANTPLAFDVHTEAEARDIDAREAAERVSRSSPVDAAAVVTSDEARRAARSGRR
jgi:hypothetical protein